MRIIILLTSILLQFVSIKIIAQDFTCSTRNDITDIELSLSSSATSINAGTQIQLKSVFTFDSYTTELYDMDVLYKSITWSGPVGGNLNQASIQSSTSYKDRITTINATPDGGPVEFKAKVYYDLYYESGNTVKRANNCFVEKVITIAVTGGNTISGNIICCSQCLNAVEPIAILDQMPGVTLQGTGSLTYQWQSYSNSAFGNIVPANFPNNPSYQPVNPNGSSYRRLVTNSSGLTSISNVVVVKRIADKTLTTTNYTTNSTVDANTMTIQGNLSADPNVSITLRAVKSINISSPSILSPGFSLKLANLCGLPATGRVSIDEGQFFFDSLQYVQVSTSEELSNSSVSLFPNPSTDQVTIKYHLNFEESVDLRIIDLVGKSVFHFSNEKVKCGVNEIIINTQDWAPGIYSYSLITNSFKETKHFIVK